MVTLSATVKERVERCVAGAEGPSFPIDDEARSHGAIALMGTIGIIWGLRPDGSFWQFDADFDVQLSPLPEEQELEALVWGAERHPWLSELLPVRPGNAAPCSFCQGKAKFGVFLCPTCRGLGWAVA